MTKESKYSKNLLKLIEEFETCSGISIGIFVYGGKPKWTLDKRIKDGNKEIKTSMEGDNLEDLLEEFYK